MTRTGRRDLAVTAAAVVAVTAVLTARSLGRGLYLYRDFVTVPDPVTGAATWGAPGSPPRSAPLDAVVVALAPVVPSGVQQQVMLLGCLLLAGYGTALLVRSWGLAAMLPAAVVAMWNPFVAERLLLGQPPTLLAYSMTPWLVLAVRSRLPGPRGLVATAVAAVPAALTPWGGASALVVVLATAAATPRRRGRWWVGALVLGVAWCLPWVVPALRYAAGAADPDGANAFAVRADGPLGVLGSVVTLGGVWASGATPASRTGWLAATAAVVLWAAALAGLLVLARRRARRAAAWLGLALVVPPVVVALLATGPGVALMRAAQAVPGLAVARDTHRWLAPAATATAVLVGVSCASVARLLVRRSGRRAPTLGGVVAGVCALALLTVPDLPKGLHAAYRPVTIPHEWNEAVAVADRVAGDRSVLVLPWSAFRQSRTAEGLGLARPFLDPLPRALRQTVVTSRQLVVVRGDATFVVDDDPASLQALAADPTPSALAAARVGAVVVWQDVVGPPVPSGVSGLELVERGDLLQVWRVTRP